MTGSCGRLLAIFSLLFIGMDPAIGRAFLYAQDAATEGVIAAPNLEWHSSLAPAASWSSLPAGPPSANATARNRLVQYPRGRGTIAFPQIVRAAGMIFSGCVTSIGHLPTTFGQPTAATAITFQVGNAIRGVSHGQDLTIREWAGLPGKGEQYRVGECVLLFLYSPGKLGLTSPVAGPLGRFAVNSQGKVVMSPQHIHVFATDPILGGRIMVPYADFAAAVRLSGRQEEE